MNDELKIIKKKYGEKMMHLCRELFATILDNHPGVLSSILLETFAPSHFLYDDLMTHMLKLSFKNYVYEIYGRLLDTKIEQTLPVDDPVTLMQCAGYTLYECKTNRSIKKFKKYYAPSEALCTFRDKERLQKCYVYFAVHDNVQKIKRRDFKYPERQDEYGTSVISIQFTKDDSHTLSIKNRYNHTVDNPDATFSNDLDNIIPGLTQSFAEYYGMKQQGYYHMVHQFSLPGYVRANDGKFYKYNYELDNIYYCPNNIVIDNFVVNQYPHEKYLVMDYFILDLVNKEFINKTTDSFPETVGNIKKINVLNSEDKKIVTITSLENNQVIIILDKCNRIIAVTNNDLVTVPNNYLINVKYLQQINLEQAVTIGDAFLRRDWHLQELSLPNVLKIGHFFLDSNRDLINISLPKLTEVGNHFLFFNQRMKTIYLPKLEVVGDGCMYGNRNLEEIRFPNVRIIGDCCFDSNDRVKEINFPQLEKVGICFMMRGVISKSLHKFYAPKVSLLSFDPYFDKDLKELWEKCNINHKNLNKKRKFLWR